MNYELKNTWVLFDLDGTLTQSEEGIWNCAKHAAKEMGLPEPDAAMLRKFIGPPLTYSFQTYLGLTPEQATPPSACTKTGSIPVCAPCCAPCGSRERNWAS